MNNKEVWDFLRSRPYQKSNHEKIDVFYDQQTFLKMHPKSSITLSPGELFIILKKPEGLSAESHRILEEIKLINETNSIIYCVLTNCLFSENETKNTMHIKLGVEKPLL